MPAPGLIVPDAYRILLVEDNEPNIMVASCYLDFFGYTHDVARNGTEAFQIFKRNAYAVILMDVEMPYADGFETTRLIRQYELEHGLRRIPIVGMTAHALAGDRERCLAAGMDDYIPKPINEPELKSKLQQLSFLK